MSPESHWGSAVNFFFYDTIKITVLLFFISVIMGAINAYFPIDRLRRYLTSRNFYGLEYFFASVFGAITPFCSCSSIPLFIGFVKGGIPLGVTFSFLITSPLVNEVAVAMFAGTFGWKITGVYIASGIIMGMIGGIILGRMKLNHLLTPWVRQIQAQSEAVSKEWETEKLPFVKRLPTIIHDAWGKVSGVSVIPAVPMYANAAGIVPVVQVFVAKGISIGTALAFMMSVVGLSLPEATLLKKVMTWKLIGIFFGVVTVIIILSGYLFNWIL